MCIHHLLNSLNLIFRRHWSIYQNMKVNKYLMKNKRKVFFLQEVIRNCILIQLIRRKLILSHQIIIRLFIIKLLIGFLNKKIGIMYRLVILTWQVILTILQKIKIKSRLIRWFLQEIILSDYKINQKGRKYLIESMLLLLPRNSS